MVFKVLVEEKKPKPPVQEPPKKVPAKPDEAIAVPVEETPKKGIGSPFVGRAVFCYLCVSFLTSHIHMRNTWLLC